MKSCKKCGSENDEQAQFCSKCGMPLNELVVEKKRGNRRIGISIVVFVLIAAILLALIPVLSRVKEKQEYEKCVSSAERYLEELNYEKAEAEYLEAININPKKKTPYVCLADIYVVQEKYEKAINILKKAKKAGAEEASSESGNSEEISIDEKIEEIKNEIEKNENKEKESEENYTWILEPTIEADDIYYLADYPDSECPVNEFSKQADNPNAVIQRGKELGIIDLAGNLLTEVAYKEIANFGDSYMMTRTVPEYSEEFGMDWDTYWLNEEGEIKADVGNGGLSSMLYYYYDGIRQSVGFLRDDFVQETAIPVQKSSVYNASDIGVIERNLSGKYALDRNGNLVTDFVYDECGSLSDGLAAVCQNGKWGYINDKGEVIIPIEYDASWQQYPVFGMGPARYSSYVKEYCYAASDNYVVLCQAGEWELKDTTGNSVIQKGIFEAIRPVFEGKCWVKKDGKWGVIQIEGEWRQLETTNNTDVSTTEEQVIDSAAKDITGMYVTADGSILSITNDGDNLYKGEILFFRITSIDDFTGKYEDNVLTIVGNSSAGGSSITSEVRFSAGQAILTITDSTFEYLKNGTQYVFSKE